MYQIILFLVDFVLQIVSKVTSFVLEPIFKWCVDLGLFEYSYLDNVQYFLNTYFYKGIRFAKEVVINITGIPNQLFILLAMLLGFTMVAYISMFAFKFIFNTYALVRGASGIKGVINDK